MPTQYVDISSKKHAYELMSGINTHAGVIIRVWLHAKVHDIL